MSREVVVDGMQATGYALTGLSGGMSVRASRDGFESDTKPADLSQNRLLNFNLRPTPGVVSDNFSGAFQDLSGQANCSDENGRPCFQFALPIHNSGRVDAKLTWTNYSSNALFQPPYRDWLSIHVMSGGISLGSASTSAAYGRSSNATATLQIDVPGGSAYASVDCALKAITIAASSTKVPD